MTFHELLKLVLEDYVLDSSSAARILKNILNILVGHRNQSQNIPRLEAPQEYSDGA